MPDVHRVTRLHFVNAFLVEEDDGLTLVDTTLGGGAGAIRAAAEQLGRPIVRIALTHAHGDHIESLYALNDELPDAQDLISTRDARLLEKDLTPLESEPPEAKICGSLPGATTTPTRLLAAGDRIGSLEVVPSPGHTPGHVSFLDTRDRTLYCGDAYTTFGVVATSAKGSRRFPLAAMVTWHPPTALESAKALRALDPARLAPGHGKVVESPGPAMDAAIARGI